METNPLKDGVLTANSVGIGTVSRGMVRDRAIALAAIDGRLPAEISRSDWDQAKREMTGGSGADPKAELLESAPESVRWDPVHGSTGEKAPTTPSEDEDDEGRSDNERLVVEGIAQAEEDQARQANRDASSDL